MVGSALEIFFLTAVSPPLVYIVYQSNSRYAINGFTLSSRPRVGMERGTRTGDGEDRPTKHALRTTGSGNLLIALKADIVVRASTADAAIRPHVLEARCVAKDTASKCYHEANAHAAL